jgi:bile acid:Na+ symporter, BASS family
VEPAEAALSATASVVYLALVLAVIGPNVDLIVGRPAAVAAVAGVALVLNAAGYALGAATRPLLPDHAAHVAMLFTVSKKEFSIAAFLVFSSGLPAEVALPAVVYAVVQMITSPLVARRLARSR